MIEDPRPQQLAPRLAAPAPAPAPSEDAAREDDEGAAADAAAAEAAAGANQPVLDELFERWNDWRTSRRFWVKPSLPVSLLGKLRTKGTGRSLRGGPDAPCDAELMAVHLALLGQPEDALDRRVLELHYVWRARDIKRVAGLLGISRAHYYRLLVACRQRVYQASRAILQANLEAAEQLPSRNDPSRN